MSGHPAGSPPPAPPGAHTRIAAGISDFARLRRDGWHYVDKTRELAALLDDDSGPLLLTRPRRFGKTLTLDTLRRFLELNYAAPGDASPQRRLFAGLAILEDDALRECRERHMGQYPVVSLSLSTVEGNDFAEAVKRLRDIVTDLYTPFMNMLNTAQQLTEGERIILKRYQCLGSNTDCRELGELLPRAPVWLCQMLHRIYSRPVCILIDEYDTPLAKAWVREHRPLPGQDPRAASGYYPAMLTLMRGLLQPLLKPQPALSGSIARCILSGCLQLTQESIFSGANNLRVLSMRQHRCATLMGFTQQEVHDLLESQGLSDMQEAVRQWYDGYTIGGTEHIYNPWSVARYCQEAPGAPDPTPQPYWANTSGNEVLAALAEELSEDGLQELRELLEGGTLQLQIREGLTYTALPGRHDDDALFSLLYHSGYLTGDPVPGSGELRLRMPNAEVRRCYGVQLQAYFGISPRHDAARFAALVTQLAAGDAEQAQLTLTGIFTRHLDIHQMRSGTGGRCGEVIYQLLVHLGLSLLGSGQVRLCTMERPLGEGRCDECFIFTRHGGLGCVLEFKVAPHDGDEALEQASVRALEQIASRRYAEGLLSMPDLGVRRVLAYGIACRAKRCRMAVAEYTPPVPGERHGAP